jgi:iron(III) transport system substrate-binding protein
MTNRSAILRPPLVALWLLGAAVAQERKVVCYVSHDFEHAEVVLKAFEAKTGIKVEAVADVEDNKTVGLANRIVAEGGGTKADVFWNNEAGQAVRLAKRGLLEPYVSPNAAAIPAAFKDPSGLWTGFAARARAIIYNTKLATEADAPKTMADLADPKFKGKIAMAKPLTGSTLTHVAAMAARQGYPAVEDYLRRLLDNDVEWTKGNAYVMKLVAEGARPFGLTDTDDAWVSQERGDATRHFIPDQEPGGSGAFLFPNTVMILKGTKRPEEARALVDYLLSPEVEEALAFGRAAQIPLHPGTKRPPHVRGLEEIKAEAVDWEKVGAEIEARFGALETLFAPRSTGNSAAIVVAVLFFLGASLGLLRLRKKATPDPA